MVSLACGKPAEIIDFMTCFNGTHETVDGKERFLCHKNDCDCAFDDKENECPEFKKRKPVIKHIDAKKWRCPDEWKKLNSNVKILSCAPCLYGYEEVIDGETVPTCYHEKNESNICDILSICKLYRSRNDKVSPPAKSSWFNKKETKDGEGR